MRDALTSFPHMPSRRVHRQLHLYFFLTVRQARTVLAVRAAMQNGAAILNVFEEWGQYATITFCRPRENSVTNFASWSRIESGTSRIQNNIRHAMYV